MTSGISGKAKLAGVMGWPVSHSLSPRLHNYWLTKYGIDGAYVPLAVKPEDFEAAVRALPKLGFRGCNVTIPHKEAAARIVDEIDDAAELIGAVNTIIVREDGSLLGKNTDALGFHVNLFENANEWTATGKTAVVLGAGGAARSVAATLMADGAEHVIIINRSEDRAIALAQLLDDIGRNKSSKFESFWRQFAIRETISEIARSSTQTKAIVESGSWTTLNSKLPDADLLVNTTSLGQTGQPPLEIDLTPLPAHAIVTDIVYNPLETDLLKRAKARGLRTVDGLGMLIQQARPGFEAWFGVKPEADEATREHLLAALAEKK